MLSNTLIGLIRTSVPLAVGWLMTQLALLGVTLPPGTELELASAGTALAAALYWATVTWLAKRWPSAGWLLGNPSQPVYTPAPAAVEVTADMTRDQYREASGL
ncbi:hypothetical protein AB2L57_10625 [Microbacterium sp. HA-8]|uniref:hypothetical protein n=1 Tax=Microbacterium sp. HA-8 TaxID=3234200 RepID=UPI0038F5FA8E